MARQASQIGASALWTPIETGFKSLMRTGSIHPDVAVLRLPGNRTDHIVFLTRHTGRTAEASLTSPTWRLFAKILLDFKALCERNGIIPMLAYIPWSTEIYARYSTRDSGVNWLDAREAMIATSEMDERAARMLAAEVGIELVSFVPAFEEAARQGKLVYRRFDDHWNSEGAEIAAQVTAAALQRRLQNQNSHVMTAGSMSEAPR
jgi:hypothetical protein